MQGERRAIAEKQIPIDRAFKPNIFFKKIERLKEFKHFWPTPCSFNPTQIHQHHILILPRLRRWRLGVLFLYAKTKAWHARWLNLPTKNVRLTTLPS